MLLPVSRQTPTWSLPACFKTRSSSSARQSLWFSTASRMPCRATTGAARLRAWADDSANRRNAAIVANVSYLRPESMTVRTTSAPARLAVRISALESLEVGLVAREGDDPFQIHRGGSSALAQGVGRGVVEHAETDLNTAGAEPAGMVEESGRRREPIRGCAAAVAGGPHGERVDDEPEQAWPPEPPRRPWH